MPSAAEILLDPEIPPMGGPVGRPVSVATIIHENAVLRSVITGAIDRLETIHGEGQDVETLIAEVRDDLARVLRDTVEAEVPDTTGVVPTLEDLELAYIQIVLKRHGGYKPAAARALGISLKTLYTKLNQIEAMAAHAAAMSR